MPTQLSIIIPTIGRATLNDTLRSLREQYNEADILHNRTVLDIIVVGDSHNNDFAASLSSVSPLCREYDAKYYEFDGGQHCYGHPQRNYGQAIATTPWLAYLQDDDIWTEGALTVILDSIKRLPHCPRLFRTHTWQCGVVWKRQELYEGNIDANCIVVPNIPTKLGTWAMRYAGDFDFIKETCALWDNEVIWEEYVIARGRPNGA